LQKVRAAGEETKVYRQTDSRLKLFPLYDSSSFLVGKVVDNGLHMEGSVCCLTIVPNAGDAASLMPDTRHWK
jgi:hypothetical protein